MDADAKLEMQAWDRVNAEDSSFREKFAAWMLTNVMKVKRKLYTTLTRRRRDCEEKRKKSRVLGKISIFNDYYYYY